tara:strand:- start:2651 stop:2941 length:291 start_codon:yes stop_codon:yes gene_type:complete
MGKLLERVDSLQNNVEKLLRNYQQLKQRLGSLQQENDKLKQNNQELLDRLENCEARFSSLKTANAMLGSKEFKKETKLKINSMMRELDACIAQLAE